MSEKGNSLIGVMIATAIMGGLSLSIAQMVSYGVKGAKSAAQALETSILKSDLDKALSSPQTCTDAMLGNPGDSPLEFDSTQMDSIEGMPLGSIADGLGDYVVQTNQPLDGGIRVSDIRLRYRRDPTDTPIPPAVGVPAADKTTHYGEIIVYVDRDSGNIASKKLFFKVALLTDVGSNVVVGCRNMVDPPPANLRFEWYRHEPTDSTGNEGCPTGWVPMNIYDDSDQRHNVNEGTTWGDDTVLCGYGINSARWSINCPSGFVDTELVDDFDGAHNLNEINQTTFTGKFCIDGISEHMWTYNCFDGWADVHIWDNANTAHNLRGNSAASSTRKLCVR